jgi:hypothetical protein
MSSSERTKAPENDTFTTKVDPLRIAIAWRRTPREMSLVVR